MGGDLAASENVPCFENLVLECRIEVELDRVGMLMTVVRIEIGILFLFLRHGYCGGGWSGG